MGVELTLFIRAGAGADRVERATTTRFNLQESGTELLNGVPIFYSIGVRRPSLVEHMEARVLIPNRPHSACSAAFPRPYEAINAVRPECPEDARPS